MKKSACLLIIIFLSFAKVADADTYTLTVDGMKCQYCAKRLERGLQTLQEVKSVIFNLNAKQVELDLADGNKPHEDQLQQVVMGAGFTLIEVTEPAAEHNAP